MAASLVYTGGRLDRAAALRGDEAWIAERLASASARLLPVWRAKNLILSSHGAERAPEAASLAGEEARLALAAAEHAIFLGLDGEAAYFAADLSALEEDRLTPLTGGAAFMDLRQAGALMDRHQAMLLAFARGMVHWHGRQRFCSDCGAATVARLAGHLRACTDPACGKEHYPRTDPAVITLVTRDGADGGSAVLARQRQWPPGMYSTLAGFVEPGESLEEAVAREVREEAGLEVADVRYRASQPWPFPASLMLGFRARAVTFDIRLDGQELEEARWFTRPELLDMRTSPLRLSRPDSISRWLIQEWLQEPPGE
jgi:NAD+ diphosphatase